MTSGPLVRWTERPVSGTLVSMARSLWVLLLSGLGACASPEDLEPGQGGLGDPCYPNGTCNSGLACVGNQCLSPDASAGGSGGASGTGGAIGGSGGAVGGSGGASGTGGASGSGSTGGTGGSSASGGSGGASGGSGGSSATGGTGGSSASGGSGGASGGSGGSSATGGTGGSSASGGAGGSGGATGAPPPPSTVAGCTSCGCCDPWLVQWGASAGATYYNVIWKCSIFPQHTINVGNVVSVDLCSGTVGMCSVSECANGVGILQVQACNPSGCSAAVAVPAAGVPIACGGGCCC